MSQDRIAVDLCCDVRSPSGYSAHARELIRAIHPLVDLKIVDHKHDRKDVDLSPEDLDLFRELADKDRQAQIRIQFETPEFFDPKPGVINLGFTQWETTKIVSRDLQGNPQLNWVKQMNRMDGMWTGCTMAAKSFKDSGVTVPVDVIHGPIDVGLYRPGLEELPIADVNVDPSTKEWIPREERPVVLGMVAQWTLRKNIDGFLIPVLSRFKRDEVTILLKTYGSVIDDEADNERVMAMVQNIRKLVDNPDAPRVVLVLSKLTDEEVARLYASMDIYVSTSRGEGLCMPLAQAMASEVYPIACGFSAPADYVDATNGLFVKYTLRPAVGMRYTPWYEYDQDWADVDQGHLVECIRYALKAKREMPGLWDQARKAARRTIETKMAHEATGKRALKLLEAALERHGAQAAV